MTQGWYTIITDIRQNSRKLLGLFVYSNGGRNFNPLFFFWVTLIPKIEVQCGRPKIYGTRRGTVFTLYVSVTSWKHERFWQDLMRMKFIDFLVKCSEETSENSLQWTVRKEVVVYLYMEGRGRVQMSRRNVRGIVTKVDLFHI